MKIHAPDHRSAALPLEVDALLRCLPERPSEVVEITELHGNSPDRGYTFRVTFPDGARMKARRFPLGFDCETLRRTLDRLPADRVARIRANNSRATLEDWVEGPTLDTLPCSKDLLIASGRFLADIHRAVPTELADREVLDQYATALETSLRSLRQGGLLDPSLARHGQAFVWRNAPKRWEQGLTHRDFCGANLVQHAGKIVAIDNVTIKISALDEDLARTWCRWPLGERDWRSFLRGYSETRDLESYLSHERFWRATTLIHSAAVRLRVAGPAEAISPISMLRELVGCGGYQVVHARFRAA